MKFENQPQLGKQPLEAEIQSIQGDPDCLRAYIIALAREGKVERIADKVLAGLSSSRSGMDGHNAAPLPSSSQMPSQASAAATALGAQRVVEGRDHWVSARPQDWERMLGSGNRSSRFNGFQRPPPEGQYGLRHPPRSGWGPSPPADSMGKGDPIRVTISEAWSWSKFMREIITRVVYGAMLITGLSFILNQQGIFKSAGMAAVEVEPHSSGQPIKFEDVQGVDEAKHELEDIVAFLKEPKKFMEIGGKLPKGILLYGPPGTGKTHLARAVAGEAGVPFFQMSGSEFDELYVGVGARRVRELFTAAKAKAPCIVFIDEIDAVGSKRSSRDQSYMRQTLNQLLVELDGFSPNEGVIFIAATNTPEALDKALVRPGRFDRHVAVPLPDVQGRARILEVHIKGVTLSPDVSVNKIARGTPGFSGADLANLVNQAAIRASKENARGVRNEDLEWAKDRIIMGAERKSAVITEHAKKLTAYHEGGHTLVAIYTPGADSIHKVTVIPRGSALGVTVQLPEGDKTTHTKREINAMIDVCMGGRAAEEIIFGHEEITTGASSDLEKASSLARDMVVSYGMSNRVGLVAHREKDFDYVGPATKILIDEEVKSLLETGYDRAVSLLNQHKEELHRLASALIEYETLTLEEVQLVIKGGDLTKYRRDNGLLTVTV
ncbi:hypothetical protein HK101_009769 [Irineochytrium annulatum]|nr:hypothetical protein HK101_009769 [Irineochytrium annulatum]